LYTSPGEHGLRIAEERGREKLDGGEKKILGKR
jgi:hypothetical protein